MIYLNPCFPAPLALLHPDSGNESPEEEGESDGDMQEEVATTTTTSPLDPTTTTSGPPPDHLTTWSPDHLST